MMRSLAGSHPDFDALSAHADRPDTVAARTKVGRHVADCATCQGTVAEIRALGSSVRDGDAPGAPAGLWARIERELDAGDVVTATAAPTEREVVMARTREGETTPPGITRTGMVTGARRAALGVVAVVAVISIVLGLDARSPLAAATPRRLTTDREFAQPGSAITFHYRPIPLLAAQPTLTIWRVRQDRQDPGYDYPLERAATLRRASALEFTGSTAMPDGVTVAEFVVGDSSGEVLDRTELRAGFVPATVLAADSRGEPRLDALVAALGEWRGSADRATATRWATRMRELYPSAPETWILAGLRARGGVMGDIVRLFESRERQYYGWHDRLERRGGLSEQTELMMANLGWELMDTARAEFWARRLLQDHPSAESVPSLWLRRYRDVPDDSAALVLRAFEPIYARTKPSRDALTRAIALAQRSGDSTLIRRWKLRVDPRDISWAFDSDLSSLAGDPAVLAEVKRRLLEARAEADSAMHAGPTLHGRSRFFAWYERQRVLTRLAALQLLGGDAKGAKVALDVIVRDAERRPSCPAPETMRWRAEASRRLGLLADARADLAYVVVTGDWRVQALRDSAALLLGDSYTKDSWDRALADASALKQKCWASSRDARRRGSG